MNKSMKYFWEYLMYYVIMTIFVLIIFFALSKLMNWPAYYGLAPLLAIMAAGSFLIDLKPNKKRIAEINKNKIKIALYFGIFQLIIGTITIPFISPSSNIGFNIIIVVLAALLGYVLCYYFIRRSINTIPKIMETLKRNIARTKDPVKKKNLTRRLKQFD